MKKVMVFGTFDILHAGHEYFLKHAKTYGNYLIVVIGRDKNVEKKKLKTPIQNENVRLKQVRNLSFVDAAILGRLDEDYIQIIIEKKPTIICLGYDQNENDLTNILRKNKLDIKIIRLDPYKENIYKSSIIRSSMKLL